jgi:hypothetical protein
MSGPKCHFHVDGEGAGLAAMWVLYVSFKDLARLAVVGPVEEVPLSRHAPVRSPGSAPGHCIRDASFFLFFL